MKIISEYESFIRGIIRTHNSNLSISEDDLFNDFYLSLVSNPIPPNVKEIKSYLYKAIINHIFESNRRLRSYGKKINKYRKEYRLNINKYDPENTLIIMEKINKYRELFENNSPRHVYIATTLKYVNGYSIEEVAEKMNVKNISVKRYISNGLEILSRISNIFDPEFNENELELFTEQPVLDFYINSGNASQEEILEVFNALNEYHRAMGGLGFEFRYDAQFIYAFEEVNV